VRRGSERVRQANATARLTTKPPLCQECAKTRKNSPTIARPAGHQPAADLGIPRRKALRENAVDMLAGIYTPAVGGSIPSAPTDHSGGAKNSNAMPSGSRKLRPDP
jgi:hypothetical protein